MAGTVRGTNGPGQAVAWASSGRSLARLAFGSLERRSGSGLANRAMDRPVTLESEDRFLHPEELEVRGPERLLDGERALGDLGEVLERLLARRDQLLVLLFLEIGLVGRMFQGGPVVDSGPVAGQEDQRRSVGRLGTERKIQQDDG